MDEKQFPSSHHPPFDVGLQPIDRIGLDEPEKLGRIIEQHSTIERILAGKCSLPRAEAVSWNDCSHLSLDCTADAY